LDAKPEIQNLYLQDMPGDAKELTWTLLTPKGAPVTGGNVAFVGASSNYSHLYYDTVSAQTPDAPQEETATSYQVYGVSDGTLYLAGILPDGTVAPSAAPPRFSASSRREQPITHIVSEDGTRVYFQEEESNLVLPKAPLYLRVNADQPQGPLDPSGHCAGITLACTVKVSASQKTNGSGAGGADPNPPLEAHYQSANQDASLTLFTSKNELTDNANTGRNGSDESTDTGNDLYLYNLASGDLTDLTVDTNPADKATGANVISVVGTSEDLSYVYFVAAGDLAGAAQSGKPNLYMWHSGSISFIATLNETTDKSNWTISIHDLSSRVTPDGLRLAFTSTEALTPFDNTDAKTGQPASEVYLYDAASEQLSCASCNPSNALPIGPSRITGTGTGGNPFDMPRNLSADGNRLFFESQDALVPRDTNDKFDVYMYEGGRIFLLSGGTGESDSRFADATPSGNDVFIGSEQQLLPQDTDALADLYDVRVDGGLPSAGGDETGCESETCRGASSTPPPAQTPASSSFAGPGNVKHHHKRKHHRKKRHQRRHHHRNHRPHHRNGAGR
jgi:hypothetical protein